MQPTFGLGSCTYALPHTAATKADHYQHAGLCAIHSLSPACPHVQSMAFCYRTMHIQPPSTSKQTPYMTHDHIEAAILVNCIQMIATNPMQVPLPHSSWYSSFLKAALPSCLGPIKLPKLHYHSCLHSYEAMCPVHDQTSHLHLGLALDVHAACQRMYIIDAWDQLDSIPHIFKCRCRRYTMRICSILTRGLLSFCWYL